jgi:hypothetical protein
LEIISYNGYGYLFWLLLNTPGYVLLCLAMAGYGWLWLAMAGYGWLWLAMAFFFCLCLTKLSGYGCKTAPSVVKQLHLLQNR